MYRLEVPPFAKARDVLESLEVDQKLTENGENADIIELCNIIPNEVLGLGHGKGYDVDKGKKKNIYFFLLKLIYHFFREIENHYDLQVL